MSVTCEGARLGWEVRLGCVCEHFLASCPHRRSTVSNERAGDPK